MTAQQILDMQHAVDAARSLNGDITILKERIAWLDEGEPVKHCFERNSDNPFGYKHTIVLPPHLEAAFREMYRGFLAAELAEKQAAFASLSFPV